MSDDLKPNAIDIKLLPIVGVMGSGHSVNHQGAARVGRWLAGLGVHLLTGAGGGLMASVSRAFFEVRGRKGLVIGIVPGRVTAAGYQPLSGYPNPWVEIPIYTHLPFSGTRGTDPLSRNHINILTANVIVAFPGSAGTASEVRLALAYNRPLAAYLDDRSQIPDLPEQVRVTNDFMELQAYVLDALDIPAGGPGK